MTVDLAGERVQLLPERAVYWPAERTLFVADPHFGKPDGFRALGVAVPLGPNAATLAKLDALVAAQAVARLVFLGDFWHSRAGVTPAVLDELTAWRAKQRDIAVTLVLGNHDVRSGKPPAEWSFEVHATTRVGPFVAAHHPQASSDGYVLCGHLHPAFRLAGRGRQSLSLPCFWVRPDHAVLPAFGAFTGTAAVSPAPGDRIFVVAESEVVEVPM